VLAGWQLLTYNPTMSENENTFNDSPDLMLAQLESLDKTFTDPFIKRVLDLGREYNKLFEETMPTPEEVAETISELDEEWGGIYNSSIRFTGMVTTKSFGSADEKSQVFLDGAEVISRGFCVELDGREDVATFKVKHYLEVQCSDVYGVEFDSDDQRSVYASGDIDNSLIEFSTASMEHATAWLTDTCPELIDEIDSRILNGKGGEDEALLSLRHLDFNQYLDLRDEFTRNCINVYIHNTLQMDDEAPYSATLNGYALLPESNMLAYLTAEDSTLMYVHSVQLHPSFTYDNHDTRWVLSAYTAILPEDRTASLQVLIMPVDTIKSLQSIRSAYYNTNS
jgi:hypothetical protein